MPALAPDDIASCRYRAARLLGLFEHTTYWCSLNVLAVFLHIAAKPGSSKSDLVMRTGFWPNEIDRLTFALGYTVEFDDAGDYSLSAIGAAQGCAVFDISTAPPTGTAELPGRMLQAHALHFLATLPGGRLAALSGGLSSPTMSSATLLMFLTAYTRHTSPEISAATGLLAKEVRSGQWSLQSFVETSAGGLALNSKGLELAELALGFKPFDTVTLLPPRDPEAAAADAQIESPTDRKAWRHLNSALWDVGAYAPADTAPTVWRRPD